MTEKELYIHLASLAGDKDVLCTESLADLFYYYFGSSGHLVIKTIPILNGECHALSHVDPENAANGVHHEKFRGYISLVELTLEHGLDKL